MMIIMINNGKIIYGYEPPTSPQQLQQQLAAATAATTFTKPHQEAGPGSGRRIASTSHLISLVRWWLPHSIPIHSKMAFFHVGFHCIEAHMAFTTLAIMFTGQAFPAAPIKHGSDTPSSFASWWISLGSP